MLIFSVILTRFINRLKEYKHIVATQSSSPSYKAIHKLPRALNEKWWFNVDDKDKDLPELAMFEIG